MKERIGITLHEFKMLQQGYHPLYSYDEEDRDDLGTEIYSKGATASYEKKVTRISDFEVFSLVTFANKSEGYTFDEPEDCDFYIDYKKVDTIDPHDELKLAEKAAHELEQENKRKQKEIDDAEKERIKALQKDFDFKNPTVPPEEIAKIQDLIYKFEKRTKITRNDFFNDFSKPIVEFSEKHQLEPESLRFALVRNNTVDKCKSFMKKYKNNYNKKFGIETQVTIQGQNFYLTQSEVQKLLKELD